MPECASRVLPRTLRVGLGDDRDERRDARKLDDQRLRGEVCAQAVSNLQAVGEQHGAGLYLASEKVNDVKGAV